MKSKLIRVGVLAFIVILAVMSGLAIGQCSRVLRFDSTRMQSQTPGAEARETNGTPPRMPNGAKGSVETGVLDRVGSAVVIATQGRAQPFRVDSQTAIYIQGETLYQTNQGDAALEVCAQERCPVYVVWSAQPDVASAIVVALSKSEQTRFPDPDPAGKTPIPLPSPTPPWIRLPSVIPATPLIK